MVTDLRRVMLSAFLFYHWNMSSTKFDHSWTKPQTLISEVHNYQPVKTIIGLQRRKHDKIKLKQITLKSIVSSIKFLSSSKHCLLELMFYNKQNHLQMIIQKMIKFNLSPPPQYRFNKLIQVFPFKHKINQRLTQN